MAGCASGREGSEVVVQKDAYAATFDATRRVLRSHRFELERVDAAAGVITTAAKNSAGFATPWDLDQTTFAQDLGDLINHQRRRVRVTFRDGMGKGGSGETDVAGGWGVADVEVFIDRVQSPGLRVPSRAPTLWSVATDPAQSARGVSYQYETPRTRDVELEKRLADEIEKEAARAVSLQVPTALAEETHQGPANTGGGGAAGREEFR